MPSLCFPEHRVVTGPSVGSLWGQQVLPNLHCKGSSEAPYPQRGPRPCRCVEAGRRGKAFSFLNFDFQGSREDADSTLLQPQALSGVLQSRSVIPSMPWREGFQTSRCLAF